jgi:hypothetical protein
MCIFLNHCKRTLCTKVGFRRKEVSSIGFGGVPSEYVFFLSIIEKGFYTLNNNNVSPQI